MSKTIHKPIVFLPIESTPRELDYKLNLARLFCNSGVDVILGNPPFIRDELKYKNYKGAFLEKGVNPDPEYYAHITKKDILLYCLSDEGAAYPAFSLNYQPAVDSLKFTEHIFLWGHFQLQDLLKRNSDTDLNKKYKVVGYPGIEFSLPKYKEYHQLLRPKSLSQQYILVNTNFGAFNGFSLEETAEACSLMSPDTRKALEASYQKEEKAFITFYTTLKEIISHFPDHTFLIRPHPTEKSERYLTFFSDFKNVIVTKEGNINNAISAAKLVIHHDCTSALQSYLMGVPVLSLAYPNIIDNNVHAKWALSFGAVPTTLKEAIDYINYALQHHRLPADIEKFVNEQAEGTLKDMFSNLGRSTIDIYSVMITEIQEKFKRMYPYKLRDTRTYLQKFKSFVRQHLPLHYKVPIASRGLLLKFTKKDLQLRLSLLQEMEGNSISYNIKKIYPNTYYISRKK